MPLLDIFEEEQVLTNTTTSMVKRDGLADESTFVGDIKGYPERLYLENKRHPLYSSSADSSKTASLICHYRIGQPLPRKRRTSHIDG